MRLSFSQLRQIRQNPRIAALRGAESPAQISLGYDGNLVTASRSVEVTPLKDRLRAVRGEQITRRFEQRAFAAFKFKADGRLWDVTEG